MIDTAVMLTAAVAVITAFAGLIYGVTGTDSRRRAAGLRVLQYGMGIAGLTLIGAGLWLGQSETGLYGLLLLVFGTGVTAIGSRPRS